MKKIYNLSLMTLGLLLLSPTVSQAQLYIIDSNLSPADVNNDGVVTGTKENKTTYRWSNNDGLYQIGTIAEGSTFMGKPLVGSDRNKIVTYLLNPETNLNEITIYDYVTHSKTYLGGINGFSDFSKSSPWGMSEDGTTIVGLGWYNTMVGQAIKWTAEDGIVSLTTNNNDSSRANSISNDKSVIAGWQDTPFGFRQGAVWKNGTQILLTDQDGLEVNEAGEYVIGLSSTHPYIWNEQTGIIYIDHPSAGNFFRGGATGISFDGSKVVGYYRGWPGGAAFGEGFIWTPTEGRTELNAYADSLGIDTQGLTLSLPLAISPDGTKIVGIGRDANYSLYGFMLDLTNYLNTNNATELKNKVSIYPNPVADVLNISGIKTEAKIEITNILGQKVKSENIKNGKVNVQNLNKGTYVISITENGNVTNLKFIKK
ncbi:MAG: T9SS type A sorting domain-containing protein [Weeksellaceae bacterium]|nr:T9SS type A sorting domain-containing protein [Weeksellaceae bacterium]